jgi:heterodisulfide reductase subunit B
VIKSIVDALHGNCLEVHVKPCKFQQPAADSSQYPLTEKVSKALNYPLLHTSHLVLST